MPTLQFPDRSRTARAAAWAMLLSVLICTPVHADAQQQEEIALMWVKAHNANDVAAMQAFRSKHYTMSKAGDWKATYQRLVSDLGQLAIRGILVDRPNQIKLDAQPANNDGVRIVFEFHADHPDQLQRISIEIAGGGDDGGGGDLPTIDFSDTWPARQGELQSYLEMLAADGLFSGAVIVANKDGVLFEGAAGLASREFNAPNTLDTRFDVGSCNKDYTKVAILQLAAQGKLSLDDTVGKHLPDYPNAEVRKQVTIQQLLDHRAGLGDYFTEEYWQTPMSKLRHVEDYIPIWGPKPLRSKPGEKEHYSNYGYTVLGAIIEKVSGQRYPDYVMEHVFEPAGMTQSGFFDTDAVVPNVAVGYTHWGPNGRREEAIKNIYLEPAKGGPWGKSFSTVKDLYRFYAGMMDGRILEGKSNWLAGRWGKGGFALAGGGPGLSAIAWVEGGLMVVVLANMDHPIAETLGEQLSRDLR